MKITLNKGEQNIPQWLEVKTLQTKWLRSNSNIPEGTILRARLTLVEGYRFIGYAFKESKTTWQIFPRTANDAGLAGTRFQSHLSYASWRFPRAYRYAVPTSDPPRRGVWSTGTGPDILRNGITKLELFLDKEAIMRG